MGNNNLLFKLSDPLNNDICDTRLISNQEQLFGQIVLNKMVGIAYKKLDNKTLNPELIKTLSLLNENYLNRNMIFRTQLKYLAKILSKAEFNYSLLKGSFLSVNVYEAGQRVSNDFDLLISSKDISKFQQLLIENGFIQGYIVNNEIVRPATRLEILKVRMNYGQTIPFQKIHENKIMTIDINFSLDFKAASNNIVEDFLEDTMGVTLEDVQFKTLKPVKFLLHLACHLYKEATTYDWLQCRRDLMLYKFCDIYLFINKNSSEAFFKDITKQVKKYGLEKEAYYTFENTSIFYPSLNNIAGFSEMKESIKPPTIEFMKQITYPSAKKMFFYDMDFIEWFFCTDRISHLKETIYEES